MRQKPVTLQARVIHFLDPHAREAGAESGRRATMLVGLGASLAGSVLFAIAVYGVCSLSIFQAGFSGWRPEFYPWHRAPPEILTALPNHERLIPSLCDYDLVGFQTGDDAFGGPLSALASGIR